ncbi:hypothetical protein Tco_1268570 [Tanacetum coccineum]
MRIAYVVSIQVGCQAEILSPHAATFCHHKNLMPSSLRQVLSHTLPQFCWYKGCVVRDHDVQERHHLKPQTTESRAKEGLMRNSLKNGGKNTRIRMETGVAGRARPFGIEITNVERHVRGTKNV